VLRNSFLYRCLAIDSHDWNLATQSVIPGNGSRVCEWPCLASGTGPARKVLEKRSTRDGEHEVPTWKLCWYPGDGKS
jgi:hypothetical protein